MIHRAEATDFSAEKKNSSFLWAMQFHSSFHKDLNLLPFLRGACPVNVLPSFFLKTSFNFVLPSTPTSSKWFLSSRFSCHNTYAFLFSTTRATCPANLILFDMVALLTLGQ